MIQINFESAAAELLRRLNERNLQVATAESCTGGLLAGALTAIPGASDSFPGGVVAYANQIKQDLLDVSESLLETFGAVSAECAQAMLHGVRHKFGTECAMSTTGIAGPGGGSAAKPVGLVYIGVATPEREVIRECRFSGNRSDVREQTVLTALNLLTELLES